MIGLEFTLILIISVLIGIFTSIFLIQIYFKTKIHEYLLFILFWFFVIYLGILIPLQSEFKNHLSYWVALETGFIWFWGALFIHSTQILENEKTSQRIRYFRNFGLVYLVLLEIIVLFWDLMIQERSKHLLWIENPHPNFEGQGAGIVFNDIVIYSTGHIIPRELFAFVSCFTFFWAYWSLKPIYQSDRVKKAHILWKLASLSAVLFIISQSLWRITDFNPQNGTIFATLIGVIAFFIIIYYPEAFILTKAQAIRVIELYEVGELADSNSHLHELPNEVYQYLLEVADQIKSEYSEK